MPGKTGFVAPQFFFLLLICLMTVGAAGCSRVFHSTYYSIHLESFKNLQNANRYVNNLTQKGKLVFWKKTDVPGKGMYYRVYLGKYKDKTKAVEFWHVLNEKGAVNYFGVHEFKEQRLPFKETESADPADETKAYQSQVDHTRAAEKHPLPKPLPLSPKERLVDNGNGTITDTATNRMWVKNGWRIDLVSAVKWKEAIKKCESFNLAGHTNWRLPTLEEWKSLLDLQKEAPALIEPNPFENIIIHMPYWTNTAFLVGSGKKGPLRSPSRAYTVMLYYGQANHQNINTLAYILPVRSLE